jgi:hypothetical protein
MLPAPVMEQEHLLLAQPAVQVRKQAPEYPALTDSACT